MALANFNRTFNAVSFGLECYLSFSDVEMHSKDSTECNKSLKHELGLI